MELVNTDDDDELFGPKAVQEQHIDPRLRRRRVGLGLLVCGSALCCIAIGCIMVIVAGLMIPGAFVPSYRSTDVVALDSNGQGSAQGPILEGGECISYEAENAHLRNSTYKVRVVASEEGRDSFLAVICRIGDSTSHTGDPDSDLECTLDTCAYGLPSVEVCCSAVLSCGLHALLMITKENDEFACDLSLIVFTPLFALFGSIWVFLGTCCACLCGSCLFAWPSCFLGLVVSFRNKRQVNYALVAYDEELL